MGAAKGTGVRPWAVVVALLSVSCIGALDSVRAETLRLAGSYDVSNAWGSSLRSIAYDGERIWTSPIDQGWASRLYKHNMDGTLSLAGSWPISSTYLTDMTFAGGYLWTSDNMTNQTVKYSIDADGPHELGRYPQPIPSALTDGAHGIGWDGQAFWLGQGNHIARVEYPSGRLLASYSAGYSCLGLEWDPERDCLWLLDNIPTGQGYWTTILRQYTVSGNSLVEIGQYDLQPFLTPSQDGNYGAAGLTVGGGYIWTTDNYHFKVLQLEVVPEPATVVLLGAGLLGLWATKRWR